MKTELRPIAQVKPYAQNPRQNDGAVDAVVASIKEFGWRQPIVVDADGIIIVGHTRYRAAQKMGLDTVPVHVATDLTPDQCRAYRIADNATGEIASWNIDLLGLELAGLKDVGFDLDLLGFDADQLAQYTSGGVTEGLTDPDDVPAPPAEAVTQPGDLWLLGDHRLLCGDSSKPDDLDRLLDGATIHLCNTDPPYNVAVEPRSNNAFVAGETTFHPVSGSTGKPTKVKATTKQLRAKDRPLANDFVSEEEFDRLLDAWFGNIARVLEPGRGFYIWGGYANLGNYPRFLKKHALYFSQAIVWDKQHPVLSRKDYMGAFEICFYGWKEGAAHRFYGPNNATDLWHVKKLTHQQMQHLTAKPADLAVRAIQYSSLAGEHVLDLFGGSGSTLIGAEQTGRNAFLMELDPLYADVIVDRYQRFTGKAAVLTRTGDSPIPVGAREEAMR